MIIDHLDDSDKDFSQSLEVQGDTKIHRVNMWTRNGKREKHIEHRKKNRNHYHQDEHFELSKKLMIIIFFWWEFERNMSEPLFKGKGMIWVISYQVMQVVTFLSPLMGGRDSNLWFRVI